MFNFLFIPSLLANNFLTFGLSGYFNVPPLISTSISIMVNSVIISSSSLLFLNSYLDHQGLQNSFQYSLAYFTNDLCFRYWIGEKREYQIKIIHHVLSMIGIYRFPAVGKLIPILYMTELTNIPLETRNILKNLKYNKYNLQEILIFILYISFGYLRIYYQFVYMRYNFKYLNLNNGDIVALGGIYILWVYWFLFMNLKIYQVFQKSIKDRLSIGISKYLKNLMRPIYGRT